MNSHQSQELENIDNVLLKCYLPSGGNNDIYNALLDTARQFLGSRRPANPQDVINVVCLVCCTSIKVIRCTEKGVARKMDTVFARAMVAYILRHATTLTLEEVGEMIDRDHTSVLHLCKKVQHLMETRDKRYKDKIRILRRIYDF